MPRAKAKKEKISQPARFIEVARELGCDEDEAHFKDALRQISRADVPPEDRKKPKRKKKSTKSAD